LKVFSNRNFILLFILLIILIRPFYFYNAFELLVLFIRLLFTETEFAYGQISFSLIDTFFSVIFFILIIPLLFIYGKRKWFSENISFISVFIFILFFSFFTAPALSVSHPDFQQNLSVTKLLSPLSKVKIVHTGKKEKLENIRDEFLNKRSDVLQSSFDHNIIFADSVKWTGNVFNYYQRDREYTLQYKPEVESRIFILGTDQYGRDILTRLIYGARISLLTGLGAVAVSFILGFGLGFAAGYSGGISDNILNRFADLFLSFPVIFFIILLLALFGNSIITVILVLGFSGWMSLFKIVRGEVIAVKNKEYILSAEMAGLNLRELMFREFLPVITVPLIVNLVFQFANVIMAEAALSYLGLGTGENYPSWGAMIQSSQGYLPGAWWMFLFPGAAIVLTIYSMNKTGKSANINYIRKAYDQPAV
jgi:peptide/nickel transport system permease protein